MLVVDDEAVIRQLIVINLELEGFEVHEAVDGLDALEKAREVDPDDSRGQLITLTPDGEARLHAAHTGRVTSITEALEGWDRSDVATLATLLHRYSEDVVRWSANR